MYRVNQVDTGTEPIDQLDHVETRGSPNNGVNSIDSALFKCVDGLCGRGRHRDVKVFIVRVDVLLEPLVGAMITQHVYVCNKNKNV